MQYLNHTTLAAILLSCGTQTTPTNTTPLNTLTPLTPLQPSHTYASLSVQYISNHAQYTICTPVPKFLYITQTQYNSHTPDTQTHYNLPTPQASPPLHLQSPPRSLPSEVEPWGSEQQATSDAYLGSVEKVVCKLSMESLSLSLYTPTQYIHVQYIHSRTCNHKVTRAGINTTAHTQKGNSRHIR